MKVVILCGGMGTRIREVTEEIPKPMIPVGPHPILWHIMKYYAHFGYKEFILCLGYKGQDIADFFLNYRTRMADFTVTLGTKPAVELHDGGDEADWRVTLAQTGLDTLTGSRLKRVEKYIGDDEEFLLTYGDGVGDIDLNALIAFHREKGGLMTVSGVRPPGRFGELGHDPDGRVTEFNEKPQAAGGLISGGFFVCHRKVFDFLDPDRADEMLERAPMQRIAREGGMNVYRHDGFWQCMDTRRDFELLTELYETGTAPWMAWNG